MYIISQCKLSYRYSAYKIIINEKFIEEDHNAMLLSLADEMEREEHKSELNLLVQEHFHVHIVPRYHYDQFWDHQKVVGKPIMIADFVKKLKF